MNTEYILQKHWAETVRLFSGLLEDNSRHDFIRAISESNILLAAECRSTSFEKDSELDDYLAQKALLAAQEFNSSNKSALGIMALAELNRFEEIVNIFSSKKMQINNRLHNEVVSNYIANGSELQITTFLKVLAQSNKRLFNRAVDKVFESNIFFTPYSIGLANELVDELLNSNDLILAAKTICAFEIKKDIQNISKVLELLLRSKLIKYAEKLIAQYAIIPSNTIILHLNEYIKDNLDKDSILRFLKLYKKSNALQDLNYIRIKLSTHLNPLIKRLSIDYESNIPVSKDTAYEICMENIKIANKSSIEFALSIRQKFEIQDKIDLEFIVSKLLGSLKPQRIELAYKIIVENNLFNKFSYRLIFYILVSTLDYQSINLARQIIKDHFQKSSHAEYLFYICSIIQTINIHHKLFKEIISDDICIINSPEDINIKHNYYGFVSNIFKGVYSIDFSSLNLRINIPVTKDLWLKLNSIVQFYFLEIDKKISGSKIKIINKNLLRDYVNRHFFDDFFIGQIIDFEIKEASKQWISLKHLKTKYNTYYFRLPIDDIDQTYVRNDLIYSDKRIVAQIASFDKEKKIIYCSIKIFARPKDIKSTKDELSPQIFEEKMKWLKNIFGQR